MNKFYFIYLFVSVVFGVNLFFFEKKTLMMYFCLFDFFEGMSFFDFMILMDWVSVLFMMVLFLITFSVGMFSVNYMSGDYYKFRFFYVLNLFVVSMILLIMVPHYIFFLIGWDGLGFTSFLLISYYKSKKSWKSSIKTFMINRLGDGMILGSVGLSLAQGHFFFFFEEFSKILFIYVVLGLFTKSAQFPFSMWLPAAMAAPTPVSALVHSSTLVTAGMYVMFRLLFFFSNYVILVMCVLGVLTIFLGSLKACVSFDSKKVVAFSTLSNLGVMAVGLGLGFMGLSFFHLMNHGMSKALLFISVGSHMSKKNHKQDLREFSKIYNFKSFSKFVGLWSKFSLMGFYYLAVFFSKDYMMESVSNNFIFNWFFLKIFFFSMMFTFMYSFRFLTFWGNLKKKSFSFFLKKNKNLNSYLSEVMLFFSLILVGGLLKKYFLNFVEGTSLLKIYLFMLLFFLFLSKMTNIFVFILKMKYFKGSGLLNLKFLGSFFFKNLDQGLFSKLKKMLKVNLKKFALNFKLKSLSFFFFFFQYFIVFFIVVLLVFISLF